MELRSPLVASASPLSGNIEALLELESAGAGAVVLQSLFEEQIEWESVDLYRVLELGADRFGEALNYFPEMDDYNTGPHAYLEYLEAAKSAVDIPVIASLNGSSRGGWIRFASLMEESGADATRQEQPCCLTSSMKGRVAPRERAVRRSLPTSLVCPYASVTEAWPPRPSPPSPRGPCPREQLVEVNPAQILCSAESSRLDIHRLNGRIATHIAHQHGCFRHPKAPSLHRGWITIHTRIRSLPYPSGRSGRHQSTCQFKSRPEQRLRGRVASPIQRMGEEVGRREFPRTDDAALPVSRPFFLCTASA
jgi:hypothetical protein